MGIDYKKVSTIHKSVGLQFEDAVFELLKKCCDSSEVVGLLRPINKQYDIEAQNGIKRLGLDKNSHIEVKMIHNPSNISNIIGRHYKTAYDQNLVYVVDLDTSLIRQYLSNIKSKDIKVISYKDLLVENKDGKSINALPFPNIIKKCLPYENLADFITYCIRMKIISSMNLGRVISSNEVGGKYNTFEYFGSGITPFVYFDKLNDKRLLFVGNNQEIKKYTHSILKDYDEIIHIQLFKGDDAYFLLKYVRDNESKSINISKVGLDDIKLFLLMYNESLSNGYKDDCLLYKYRTFQRSPNRKNVIPRVYRSNKEAINFINKNTFNSLSKGTLWFSNKEQVNDPFDLDIREPKNVNIFNDIIMALPKYITRKSEYAVLCVTRANDNLLMWSHYGDSHKGVCSSYSKAIIINEIEKDLNISLCLYGNIEYLFKRPSFKPLFSLLPYVEYNLFLELFNIRCLFSKYRDWSYEQEMRFAILPTKKDAFSGGYGGIKHFPLVNYYGNRLEYDRYGVYFRVNKYSPVNTFKLSDSKYELIPVTKYI